jgi:hypothetical protein
MAKRLLVNYDGTLTSSDGDWYLDQCCETAFTAFNNNDMQHATKYFNAGARGYRKKITGHKIITVECPFSHYYLGLLELNKEPNEIQKNKALQHLDAAKKIAALSLTPHERALIPIAKKAIQILFDKTSDLKTGAYLLEDAVQEKNYDLFFNTYFHLLIPTSDPQKQLTLTQIKQLKDIAEKLPKKSHHMYTAQAFLHCYCMLTEKTFEADKKIHIKKAQLYATMAAELGKRANTNILHQEKAEQNLYTIQQLADLIPAFEAFGLLQKKEFEKIHEKFEKKSHIHAFLIKASEQHQAILQDYIYWLINYYGTLPNEERKKLIPTMSGIISDPTQVNNALYLPLFHLIVDKYSTALEYCINRTPEEIKNFIKKVNVKNMLKVYNFETDIIMLQENCNPHALHDNYQYYIYQDLYNIIMDKLTEIKHENMSLSIQAYQRNDFSNAFSHLAQCLCTHDFCNGTLKSFFEQSNNTQQMPHFLKYVEAQLNSEYRIQAAMLLMYAYYADGIHINQSDTKALQFAQIGAEENCFCASTAGLLLAVRNSNQKIKKIDPTLAEKINNWYAKSVHLLYENCRTSEKFDMDRYLDTLKVLSNTFYNFLAAFQYCNQSIKINIYNTTDLLITYAKGLNDMSAALHGSTLNQHIALATAIDIHNAIYSSQLLEKEKDLLARQLNMSLTTHKLPTITHNKA